MLPHPQPIGQVVEPIGGAGKPTNRTPLAVSSRMAPDFAASNPLRPLVLTGALTLLAYASGVVAVSMLAEPYAPTWKHQGWTILAIVFVIAWLSVVVVMALRKPDLHETITVWAKASLGITYVSQAVVAAAIWGFFPHCPESTRVMLAAMFMICSPAQLIAAPENVVANRWGIVASSGSLVLWFVLYGSSEERTIAMFIFMVALMLLGLCNYVPGTMAEAVNARLAAEQAKTELQRALAEVSQERDAKTRFMAAASHDLGQPLHAASLYFDQTLRAADASQRERAAEGVRKAFASADQLISHMLNHLRLEADAVDPHFSRVHLGVSLAHSAMQVGPAATEAGIAIRVVPTRLRLRLDKVLFERAISNLLNNALVHSGADRITIGARRSGPHVRIWVIDNGRGIPPEDTERVFEDYFRGASSKAALASGFGLGLSSVRRIATLMGGTAGLDARWHKGAAFFLQFPASGTHRERTS